MSELSRVEDLLVTGVEQPVEPMSRMEAILRGDDIKPQSRIEELLKQYDPGGGGAIELDDLSVTANGLYTPQENHAYKSVDVAVPPTPMGTINITENGTYHPDVGRGFNEVNVNVQSVIPEDSLVFQQGDTKSTTGSNISGAKVNHYYLFTTVYNSDNFSGASVVAGDTNSVWDDSTLAHCVCLVRALDTTISYGRYGDISPSKYTELEITVNGVDKSSDVTIVPNGSWQNTRTMNCNIGDLIMVLTSSNAPNAVFNGADIICKDNFYNSIEGTKWFAYIIKATSTTVSAGYDCRMMRLKVISSYSMKAPSLPIPTLVHYTNYGSSQTITYTAEAKGTYMVTMSASGRFSDVSLQTTGETIRSIYHYSYEQTSWSSGGQRFGIFSLDVGDTITYSYTYTEGDIKETPVHIYFLGTDVEIEVIDEEFGEDGTSTISEEVSDADLYLGITFVSGRDKSMSWNVQSNDYVTSIASDVYNKFFMAYGDSDISLSSSSYMWGKNAAVLYKITGYAS